MKCFSNIKDPLLEDMKHSGGSTLGSLPLEDVANFTKDVINIQSHHQQTGESWYIALMFGLNCELDAMLCPAH
ncbi:UNVERIFIED_CONTAM: hypothetical protein K2H54_035317 [Gekko kuhli]